MRKYWITASSCGLAIVMLLLAVGCGGSKTTVTTTPEVSATTPTSSDTGSPSGKAFTAAELATFNGKNGKPAYIAVDGVVYDVSNSSLWAGGQHSVCNLESVAGKDLSEVIKQAPPKMRENLKRFPIAGQLSQ